MLSKFLGLLISTFVSKITLEGGFDKIIILSAIDNLIKGGAGQAVQNLNNKFNFSETTGLK